MSRSPFGAYRWAHANVHIYRMLIGRHWVLHHEARDLTEGWTLTVKGAERAAERARNRRLKHSKHFRSQNISVNVHDREPQYRNTFGRAVRAIDSFLHPRRTRSQRIIAAALTD